MSTLFSAREVCDLALRKIGYLSANDVSASEQVTLTALKFLDVLLGNASGTTRLWFFIPADVFVTWPAGQTSINLTAALNGAAFDFVKSAWNDDTTEEYPLVRRDFYEAYRTNNDYPVASSRFIYIEESDDGQRLLTAYMACPPSQDLHLRLVGQRLAPSVATATKDKTGFDHGFEAPWQLWMIVALAAIIGDGPIAKLPEGRIQTFNKNAHALWAKLESMRSAEQIKRVRFTRGDQSNMGASRRIKGIYR